MIHKTLCREKLIKDFTISVKFKVSKQATLTKIESKRNARVQLENGNALIIFPAGSVATAKNIFGKA